MKGITPLLLIAAIQLLYSAKAVNVPESTTTLKTDHVDEKLGLNGTPPDSVAKTQEPHKQAKINRKLKTVSVPPSDILSSVSFSNEPTTFKAAMESPGIEPEELMKRGGEPRDPTAYPLGTDLNTIFTRPSLDFTDNLKDIVGRILVMRKDLQKSKHEYFNANSKHLTTSSNYEVYNDHGYLNRPDYMPDYNKSRSQSQERRLLDQKPNTAEYLKYMTAQEFERSGFEKTLNDFNYRDIYKISKADLLGNKFQMRKQKLDL